MLLLKQSTATTVKIGPFLDNATGTAAQGGLAITQADVRLSKNSGNMAQKNSATACVHDEIGIYDCDLDTTDTGTLGRLQLYVHESGALPVWHEYSVMPANVYDSVIGGSDYLEVDSVAISASTAAADNVQANIGNLDAAISGLNDITVASVTAGVDDLLRTVTISELAQQAPPATPTLEQAVMYVYNALTQSGSATASLKTFSNSAGTVIWKKTVTATATQYTEAKGVSGP